jgi:hypothetical protein
MKMVHRSLDGPQVEVTIQPKWSGEQLRLARKVAFAGWKDQGWSCEKIAALFCFSPAYIRQELAELATGFSTGRAVARPRTTRRLRDPYVRAFRRREMWGMRQHGLTPVEIGMFFSCTADHVRKELARPEPTGPEETEPATPA